MAQPAPYNAPELKRRMHGAVDALKHDFGGLRTGRASVNLLDPVMVDAYGQRMPLNQVGTVSAPEPRLLSVSVWDKSLVTPTAKAIRDAVASPDVRQKLQDVGVTARGATPDETRKLIASDVEKWRRVIEAANIPKQ